MKQGFGEYANSPRRQRAHLAGGQNQVLLTAQGMRLRGHDVAIAAFRGGALETRALAAGIDTCSISFHGDISPAAVYGLVRELRARRPEIVHAHDAHALSTALIAIRIAHAGVLVAARRVDFSLRGAFSRFKYRQARRIIAASRAIASFWKKMGLPGNAFASFTKESGTVRRKQEGENCFAVWACRKTLRS